MLRKTISIVIIGIGLLAVVLAIASATAWKASETVTATLPAQPGTPVVTTDPGVLDLVAEDVAISATAPEGAPVVLAIGYERDVTGWVGDAAHTKVTGMTSWTELATEEVEGAGEVPSPAGSDMWVVEASGAGQAELVWSQVPGRWSLLAATDGKAPAPSVELTWQREVATPLLVPGVVIGALLVLVGAVLAYFAFRPATSPDVAAIRERLAAVPTRRGGSAGKTAADGAPRSGDQDVAPEGGATPQAGTSTEETS